MYIINRLGERETVKFDKILLRIQDLAYGLNDIIDVPMICQRVINGMYAGIKTSQLDELAAQECAYLASTHPDYSNLAARISVSNLHKNTDPVFTNVISKLYNYTSGGAHPGLIGDEVYAFIMANQDTLNEAIDYKLDFDYDYFGFKTLEKSYLLKIDGLPVERPQHLLMRVSCGIHYGDIDSVLKSYTLMSQKYFTHATPTLFNSGTRRSQMSSCFLLDINGDSIDGIFDTVKECALISKFAGGIGLSIHKIRSKGSYVAGTNGNSNGIVPMLKVLNATARYVDQGGGRRKGSFAIYLEPWHADIFEFLELKKNHGNEEQRARDLFYALWVCDLFMKRVDEDAVWSLFDPKLTPDLAETWGADFDKKYIRYEAQGIFEKQVKAREVWVAILKAQIETGTPFMVYKDACNRKSNQQNLGTIKSSNLCTEIVQYSSPTETGVCNLASVSLPKFVNVKEKSFDYETLKSVVAVVVNNLNRVIDRSFYPDEKTRYSNFQHRPMAIGIQGLADVYQMLGYPYESEEARLINRNIFETMYYGALDASCEAAKLLGTYGSYEGSPVSQGRLQFDLWNEERAEKGEKPVELSGFWDWDSLRAKIAEHGLRNSLLLAPMPTASTSQLLGNCESFEPYTSNVFSRRVLSGEFCIFNKHLVADLMRLDLWNDGLRKELLAHNGSVAYIDSIPNDIKAIYKTCWEIKQRAYIDHSIDRAPFICQSQSLSLFVANPSYSKLTSMHFYAWRSGLKTGLYYLRTNAAVDALKFTVDQQTVMNAATAKGKQSTPNENENVTPKIQIQPCPFRPLESDGECLSCSG